jgi:osmotically-inducible protein OsmY
MEIVQVMRAPRFSAFLLGEYDRPDADVETEINKRVIQSGFVLDRLTFAVTVESGVVTLTGLVAGADVAVSLLADIRQVAGVVAVRDRLSYRER